MTSRLEINVSKFNRCISSVTSKGNQTKWFKDGHWLKANNFGYEDVAEFVAYNLLTCSNVNPSMYAKYELCTILEDDNQVSNGCYSPEFLENDDNLVTFYRLFTDNGIDWENLIRRKSTPDKIKAVIDIIHKLTNLDITDYLKVTMTLDTLIYNEDRHMANLSVIYNESNLFKIAPIFDNGLSCLSDTGDYNLSYDSIVLLQIFSLMNQFKVMKSSDNNS